MGFQTVRALVRITHDGVDRIPGQATGKNAQDFVVSDTESTRLQGLGAVTSLGVADEPVVAAEPLTVTRFKGSGKAAGVLGDGSAAIRTAVSSAVKEAVAFTTCTQSVGAGAVTEVVASAETQSGAPIKGKVYMKAPSQGIQEPTALAKGYSGSPWVETLEQLGSVHGIKALYEACGVGGASIVTDMAGVMLMTGATNASGWRPLTVYRGTRPSEGPGDLGTLGQVIYVAASNSWWMAEVGDRQICFYDSDSPIMAGNPAVPFRRNITAIYKDGTKKSGAVEPNWPASPVVNVDTRTDGDITWRCVRIEARTVEGFHDDGTGMFVLRTTHPGFDPFKILWRNREANIAMPVASYNHFTLLSTAQSDVNKDMELIARAHHQCGTFMLTTGYSIKPIHHCCIYYPPTGGQGFSQAQYDRYERALATNGLDGEENFATSRLAQMYAASNYTLGIPGTTPRTLQTQFFIIRTAYRRFGLNVGAMLTTPQPDPHLSLDGALKYGRAHVDDLRKIFLNVAA